MANGKVDYLTHLAIEHYDSQLFRVEWKGLQINHCLAASKTSVLLLYRVSNEVVSGLVALVCSNLVLPPNLHIDPLC